MQNKGQSTVVRPGPAFTNAAGSISNIAFGEFRCVSIIRSLRGSYRSRHYHQTDSHVLYVLEGQMVYWERTLDGEYGAPKIVEAGESIETGPLVVHQSFFPVNTILVSASRLPRDHDSHESDVVRVEEDWQVHLVAE